MNTQLEVSDLWIRSEAGGYLQKSRRMVMEAGATLHFPPPRYEEYLASSHWRNYRRKRIRAASEKCDKCGLSRKQCWQRYECDLNVHHLHYESLWKETKDDTRVLCLRCHLEEECENLGHHAFIDLDGKRVRCVCGELNGK